MSHPPLGAQSISSTTKTTNIRLRKSEYQYDLTEGIAPFQPELNFQDVKDLTKKLYREERADKEQFIRKLQAILKKVEEATSSGSHHKRS